MRRMCRLLMLCVVLAAWTQAAALELPDLVAAVRPSVVGVASHEALRRPPVLLTGTGFVVGDGNHVITNAHVVGTTVDVERRESRVILVGRGKDTTMRSTVVVAIDRFHDLALLRFDGPPLPSLQLGDAAAVREGQGIAFTGFPIGSILGSYPVTHRGIVSAISPIAIPQVSLKGATASQLRRLREPFDVFQLDATAYPGNSGSPLFDRDTGLVIGVVNSVLVKQSKENILKDPSAIAYAIPVAHAIALIKKHLP